MSAAVDCNPEIDASKDRKTTGKVMVWRQSAGRGWWRWVHRAGLAAALLVLGVLGVATAYRFTPPPLSALMLLRAAEGAGTDYRWVPMAEISPNLARAVITSEDARFCSHHGVDWDVLMGIVNKAVDAESAPARGGSTIDMQTVKNLFLWPQRSYVRKALEIPLAMWIDVAWPKQRIIEVYLNIAEWGPGIYGAEAAAQHYFHKPAAKLSRHEAAVMAAVLPNPLERSVVRPNALVRRIARRIQRRVAGTVGYLDCLPSLQ